MNNLQDSNHLRDLHNEDEIGEIDQNFINTFLDDEKNFEQFYNKEVRVIRSKFYYLDQNNEVYDKKVFELEIVNGLLKKESLLFLLKKNQYIDTCRHKLLYLLKYNFDIDYTDVKDYLNKNKSQSYLTSYKIIQDVYFKDAVPFFSDLNTLIFVMKKCMNSNSTTKKIYLK